METEVAHLWVFLQTSVIALEMTLLGFRLSCQQVVRGISEQ